MMVFCYMISAKSFDATLVDSILFNSLISLFFLSTILVISSNFAFNVFTWIASLSPSSLWSLRLSDSKSCYSYSTCFDFSNSAARSLLIWRSLSISFCKDSMSSGFFFPSPSRTSHLTQFGSAPSKCKSFMVYLKAEGSSQYSFSWISSKSF